MDLALGSRDWQIAGVWDVTLLLNGGLAMMIRTTRPRNIGLLYNIAGPLERVLLTGQAPAKADAAEPSEQYSMVWVLQDEG
jgi:hypothetical protein